MILNKEKTLSIIEEHKPDEIKKVVNSIPKDVVFNFFLKDINFGYIRESYNWHIQYQNHFAHIKTNYHFSAIKPKCNKQCDDGFEKFLTYEEALAYILSQIPGECYEYVKIKRTTDEE